MPLTCLHIFILGLFAASLAVSENGVDVSPALRSGNATTNATTNATAANGTINANSTVSAPTMKNTTTVAWTTNITSVTVSSRTMNTTQSSNITTPATTKPRDATTPKVVKPTVKTNAPKTQTITTTTTKSKGGEKGKTSGIDSTGFIILFVIILVALIFGLACYFSRRRARSYSTDYTSKPDEANIPLSTVDPVQPPDTISQNGLQTFESLDVDAKDETEAKPGAEEEQKAEAEKPADGSSAEAAAPAPAQDSAEDKPKEAVTEESPAAPAEPKLEDKTDDEGAVSNKTSVESLKDTNENNSNNVSHQQGDWESSSFFWDVPLNCPV